MSGSFLPAWLAAVAVKVAAVGAAGSFEVRMPLIAVSAVAAPAGQVLQRCAGGVPVSAVAGGGAAGLGAQQPLRVGPVSLVGRDGRPLLAVASMVGALATAAALPLPACPAGPVGGLCGRRSRSSVPGHPPPNMLGRR
jgi:hypothetical protein